MTTERLKWIRRCGAMALLLVMSAAPVDGATGGDDASPSSQTRVQRFYLKAGDGEYFGQLLVARRYDEREMVQRFLVVSPERHRLVVTSRVDFPQGVYDYELLDEATGWWARLEIDPGLGELTPFGRPGAVADLGRRLVEEDPWMSFSLSTADGFWWRRQALASEEGDPFAGLGGALADARTAAGIPAGATEAAAFLAPVVARRTIPEADHYLATFLEVISVAAGGDDGAGAGYRELAWEVGPGDARVDAAEIGDDERELIRRFPSLAEEGLFGRRMSEAKDTAEEMEP